MSATANNLELHFYLAHFPADGKRLDEGTSKAVDGLAAGAARCGARVAIVCDGAQTSRTTSPRGYEILSFTAADLEHYVAALNGNAFFVLNGVFHPRVYAMSRLLDRRKIGYVIAPHDPYSPAIFARRAHLKWPYWFLRERPMLRRARAVQVLDARHARFLKDLGVATPVIASCNGFAPEDVCPEDSLRWRTDGAARVLFLGRLDAFNKGLDLLIEACRELSDVTLTIQGPDWGDAEQLKKLPGASRVTFAGPNYEKRPWEIMLEHDVLCLPSRFEGFGLSALEAMLAARVVLVSSIAGIAPHVTASACGVVIEPKVDSIRGGLASLMARRARWREMGLAGREYAQANLEWSGIAGQALRDYQQVRS